jgi:hypothetical protein
MGGTRAAIGLLAAGLILAAQVAVASADGGAVRYSEQRYDRLITVFTAPTPLRAGIVDVSVLIQDANSGNPLPDVPVTVTAYPIHNPEGRIRSPATTEAATNKLLRAAQLDFAESGQWRVELAVEGLERNPSIGFDVEVAEALPSWVQTALWIGWPLAAIALFALHQFLVRRRPLQRQRGRISDRRQLLSAKD